MKIDLDEIERVAKAAQEERSGDWIADRLMTADWHEEMRDGEGYAIVASGGDVVIDGGMCRAVADHIATCSPDVVLALVARVREVEGENSVMWADKTAAMMRKSDIPRSLFDDEKGKRIAAEADVSQLRSRLNVVREFLRGLQDVASPVGPAAEAVLKWLGEP